MGGRGVGAL